MPWSNAEWLHVARGIGLRPCWMMAKKVSNSLAGLHRVLRNNSIFSIPTWLGDLSGLSGLFVQLPGPAFSRLTPLRWRPRCCRLADTYRIDSSGTSRTTPSHHFRQRWPNSPTCSPCTNCFLPLPLGGPAFNISDARILNVLSADAYWLLCNRKLDNVSMTAVPTWIGNLSALQLL